MPTTGVIATGGVYLFLVLLVLSLSFASTWRWWVKGAAIVLSAVLFVGSYMAINALLGWPTTTEPPGKYALLWSKITEPDKFTGAPGKVYVWTRELREDGSQNPDPRAFQLTYSEALVQQLDVAQQQRSQGEEVFVDQEILNNVIAAGPDQSRVTVGNPNQPAAGAEAISPNRLTSTRTISLPLLILTVAAYVLIAVLLVSLNLTSRWRWYLKGAGIVVTTVFFVATYFSVTSLLGWPTTGSIPNRFSLLWTEVLEPEKSPDGKGAVYMWLEELDEYNLPAGMPRSYRMAYTPPLAEDAEGAQERREQGEEVMGQVQEMTEEERLAIEEKEKNAGPKPEDAEETAAADTVPFMEQDIRVNFQELPPVVLPDKGAL